MTKSNPVSVSGCWQRPHNNVHSAYSAINQFSSGGLQPTAHEVTSHCVSHLLRDDEAESRGCIRRAGNRAHDHGVVHVSPSSTKNGTELRCREQAIRSRQHRRLSAVNSGGKLGATLAAASAQDAPAGTRAHPKTETVHLGTAAVVGLESSLAHCFISTVL